MGAVRGDVGCGCRGLRPARDLVLRADRLARARAALGRRRLPAARDGDPGRAGAVPRLPVRVPARGAAADAPAGVHELELRHLVRGADGRLRRRLHRRCRVGAARSRRRSGSHVGRVARDRRRAARPRLPLRHALRPVADAARSRRPRGPRPRSRGRERRAPRARLRREALAGGPPPDRARPPLAAKGTRRRARPPGRVRRRRGGVLPALRDHRAGRPARDVRRPARPAACRWRASAPPS